MIYGYARDEEPALALTPEEEADLMEAQAEMQRGEFASDAEVEAVFTKYRRASQQIDKARGRIAARSPQAP